MRDLIYMPIKIQNQIELLTESREMLDALKGKAAGERVQSSGIMDSTGSIACQIADIDSELKKLNKEYLYIIGKLAAYLLSLDGQMERIMRMRFIEGMTTYAIADLMGIDRTTVSKKITKELKRMK